MGTNSIYGAVLLLLLLVGAFFFGRYTVKEKVTETSIERDTVVLRDTIREYYPQEVVRTVVRTERVEVPIVRCDTIREYTYRGKRIQERGILCRCRGL